MYEQILLILILPIQCYNGTAISMIVVVIIRPCLVIE